jgi:hypothetical protein
VLGFEILEGNGLIMAGLPFRKTSVFGRVGRRRTTSDGLEAERSVLVLKAKDFRVSPRQWV